MMSNWLLESTLRSTVYRGEVDTVIDTVIPAGRPVEHPLEGGNGATKCRKVQRAPGLRCIPASKISGRVGEPGRDRRHAIVEWSTPVLASSCCPSQRHPPYAWPSRPTSAQRGFPQCVIHRAHDLPGAACYSGVFAHARYPCAPPAPASWAAITTAGFSPLPALCASVSVTDS
jgi:hypothetical protein